MHNRRHECEIASKCTETSGLILADIAEHTVTPALATQFEGAKIDICGSLLLFIPCIRLATMHTVKFTRYVGLHITAPFDFSSDVIRSIMTLST